MIIIEPQEGLANRLRVIASGLWMRERKNGELYVIWREKPELNCNFGDLFLPVPGIHFITPSFYHRLIRLSFQLNPVKRRLVKTVNKWCGVDLCINDIFLKHHVKSDYAYLCSTIDANENIYFRGCYGFGESDGYYSFLKPSAEIQERIDRQTAGFTSFTIGLHIRRTDNEKAKRHSPVRLFLEVADRELEKNECCTLFLATDDYEVERQFKQRYGPRILTNSKQFDRNTKQGAKDAVVDLYCLAQTSGIYGSYWSSFSEVAAKIGKKELVILKEGDT